MKTRTFRLIFASMVAGFMMVLSCTLAAGSYTYSVGNSKAGASAAFYANKSTGSLTAGVDTTLKALDKTTPASFKTTVTGSGVNLLGTYTIGTKKYTIVDKQYTASKTVDWPLTVTFLDVTQSFTVYCVPVFVSEKIGGAADINGTVSIGSKGCTVTDQASIWGTASGTVGVGVKDAVNVNGTISGKVIDVGIKASATVDTKGKVTASSSLFAQAVSGKASVGYTVLKVKKQIDVYSWSGSQIKEYPLI